MIEIICLPSGDVAYADDPEAALMAAKTLCADDTAAMPLQGRERSVQFRVNGSLVRALRERDLWGAI